MHSHCVLLGALGDGVHRTEYLLNGCGLAFGTSGNLLGVEEDVVDGICHAVKSHCGIFGKLDAICDSFCTEIGGYHRAIDCHLNIGGEIINFLGRLFTLVC